MIKNLRENKFILKLLDNIYIFKIYFLVFYLMCVYIYDNFVFFILGKKGVDRFVIVSFLLLR